MAFVANFIRFPVVQFDKVRDSLKVGRFFETQCRQELSKC